MSSVFASRLVQALREPGVTGTWSAAQWTEAWRQARATGLTGRLADRIRARDARLLDPGDDPPDCGGLKAHMASSLRVCAAQRAEVLREARHLDHNLASLDAPVVLLKGAAYAVAGLAPARGRVFSDIDILVPKTHIGQAESLLGMNGWMSTETSAYNQHYYRAWMHELPPMQHLQRGTILDLHHNILPETARLRPDAKLLIAAARRLPGTRVLHVLAPVDMLLHSMTHLFMNDDMSHALRDLSDLDLLLREFAAADPDIWQQMLPRALQLNLQGPLFHALQALERIFATPLPVAATTAIRQHSPGALQAPAMRWIWRQAFATPLPPQNQRARAVALAALYLRGHWLRMPPLMLARHLFIKATGLHEKRSLDPSHPRVKPFENG